MNTLTLLKIMFSFLDQDDIILYLHLYYKELCSLLLIDLLFKCLFRRTLTVPKITH